MANRYLLVFGVDAEVPEIAHDYLTKYGYTLRSLVDGKEEAVKLHHVVGRPTTVLIDREGKVAYYESLPLTRPSMNCNRRVWMRGSLPRRTSFRV